MALIQRMNTSNRTLGNNKNNIQNPKKEFLSSTQLTCDCCFSQDIIETLEGYVCRDCGVVLEMSKLEYHRPYNEDTIQTSIMGTTQIGLARERTCDKRSVEFQRLSRLQNIKDNKQMVEDQARLEIKRIFNGLDLPATYKDMVFKKFREIRAKLGVGTKYRSPEKLVPIIIYFVLKLNNYIINQSELLDLSKLSKKDFNSFKLQMARFMPSYQERNRKEFIAHKIFDVAEHFGLGMAYYHFCKDILEDLWPFIKNTKDDVVAGLVCSVAVLTGEYEDQVSIFAICTRLNIRMSTIQTQVKHKIFENFKIPGFTTLIQSKGGLKVFLVKRRVLDVEVGAQVQEVHIQKHSLKAKLSLTIRKITLRGNKQVFNALKESFTDLLIEESYVHTQTPSGKVSTTTYQEGYDRTAGLLLSRFPLHEGGEEEGLLLQFFSGKGPPLRA